MAKILDLFGRRDKAEARNPGFGITRVHFFPLGGIDKTAGFTNEFGAARPMSRAAGA